MQKAANGGPENDFRHGGQSAMRENLCSSARVSMKASCYAVAGESTGGGAFARREEAQLLDDALSDDSSLASRIVMAEPIRCSALTVR